MKNKNEQSTASSLLRFAGPYKGRYVLSICLSVLGVASGLVPYYAAAQILIGLIGTERNFSFYIFWGIIAVVGYLAKSTFAILSTSISHTATFLALRDIRKQIVDKFSRMPMGTLLNTPSGQLKDTLVDRVEGLETPLAHLLPEMSANVLVPVFIVIYLFVLDWRMALISLITIPVGMAFMATILKTYPQQYEGSVKINQQMNNAVVEYVNGIEVIKAFGKTESSYAKFTKAAMEYADSFISWMKRCSIFHALLMVVTPYTLLTVLPFGAHYVENGTLTISSFVMCIILSLGIVGPIITVGSYTDDLGKISVIVDEVVGILKQPELKRPEKSTAAPKDNSITLTDVKFGYHEREILHGVNMKLGAGTVNAIVGPSGSGKSTIAKLIASLWDVNSGSIKIGGVDVKQMSFTDFNQKIAYVAQDNYLFNESVRENIRQGNPNATDEQIIEVTKKSGCYDFIMQLENGFDTIVGGAGGHLSGGERQRISIARAMLKDAPIVILDEATAYTDPENEAILQNSIAKLVAGRTLIVIAHRLSTVKDSDQIFVVNDGNIAAHGTHEELLASCPLYEEMWNAHISAKDTVKEEN